MADILFKIIGDDTDVRKKLKELNKLQTETGGAFEKAFKGSSGSMRSVQETLANINKKTTELKATLPA